MQPNVTSLERAFELARSGRVSTVTDLKKRLKHEGYSLDHITGKGLTKQLNLLLRKASGDNLTSI